MTKTVKKTGEVYTPVHIVENILNLAGYKGKTILKKHIIDNSCGDGAFLKQIVTRYVFCAAKEGYSNTQIKEDLQKYIHGIELNKSSCAKAIENLNNLIIDLGFKFRVKWDILNEDALQVKLFDKKMDFVVGNPPYIRIHDLSFGYKEYQFAKKGMTDLYLIFFEIGIRMLKPSGKLSYITPNSYLTSDAGRELRKYLMENNMIAKVLNLGHDNPFESITTYPMIIVLENNKKNTDVYVYNKNYKLDYKIKNGDFVIDDSYFFIPSSDLKYLREIFLCKKETPKVFVRNGLATNADWFFYNNNYSGKYIISAIKSSKAQEMKLFFPYTKNGELIDISEIKANSKSMYKLLLENKKFLLDRSIENESLWYGFARTQAIKDVFKDKISVNSIIKSLDTIKIKKAPAGTAVYSGLYVYSNQIDMDYIIKTIRSIDFIRYIKLLGKDKRGQYYYVSSTDLQTYLNYSFKDFKSNECKNGGGVSGEQLWSKLVANN